MVTLTEAAAAKMREVLNQDAAGACVRLFVARGGCAGLSYGLEIEDRAGADDHVFESHGVRLVVDPGSLPLLDGSEVEFVDTVERTGFVVNNPNAVSGCGCGHSFQTAEGEAMREE